MDKKKILEALKLIKESFSAQAPQKFTDAKLNDGVTIISYEGDKLDVGVAVMGVTDQGKLPLPDGDYTLEDGTTFNIATGVVTAVTPVNDAPPAGDDGGQSTPAASAAMTEGQAKTIVESVIRESRFAEDIAEIKAQIAESKAANEAFAAQKAEDKTTIEKLTAELKESKELMLKAVELIEKVADIPSDTPANGGKTKFSVSEFRKAYREDLLNLKKTN